MSTFKKHLTLKKGHFMVKVVFRTSSPLQKSLSRKSENTKTWVINPLPPICSSKSQGSRQLMTTITPISTKKHQSRAKSKALKKAKSFKTWSRISPSGKSSKWTKFRKILMVPKPRKNIPSTRIKITMTKMIKKNLAKISKTSEEDFMMQLT